MKKMGEEVTHLIQILQETEKKEEERVKSLKTQYGLVKKYEK